MAEANKEDSERCIAIALQAIKSGNVDKAIRFLERSDRLYPNDRAKELLNRVQSAKESGETKDQSEPRPRSRNNSGESRNRSPGRSAQQSRDYTEEQVTAVNKIRKCKDYYEVLGLTRECSESELKKSYRKLALQFHPDKNKAPGAAEAFKAIGNAFAVLSNAEKRRQYDLYGADADLNRPSSTARRRHYHSDQFEHDFSRGFESEMTAEELFNLFFGGGFGQGANVYHFNGGRVHAHRRNAQQHQQAQVSTFGFWLQLLPLIALVSVSLLSTFLVSEPMFNLSRNAKYSVERRTRNMNIAYYVKPDFPQTFSGKLERFERQVEEEYVSQLQMTCYRERAAKENLYLRAQYFGNREMYKHAENMATPACDTLKELVVTA